MKIAIAGGKTKADFLIGALLEKEHELSVINNDEDFCEYLAETHRIPIFYGNPSKSYILEDAGIRGYDIIIALSSRDSDNLAICQIGKRMLDIKRAVAVVSNPKNVRVFKKLGVNSAISATYMLANLIAQASTLESLKTGHASLHRFYDEASPESGA